MDNEKNSQSRFGNKKIVISLGAGLVLLIVIALIIKNSRSFSGSQIVNQEAFQGPAELSAAVLNACQESAEKIVKSESCENKKNEYLQNVEGCAQAYISVDNQPEAFEGNYGDFAVSVAQCYQKSSQTTEARAFLELVAGKIAWDFYMGPVTCDSQSVLSAYIESFSDKNDFACYKQSDLNKVLSELKNKNFGIVTKMLPPGSIGYQGVLEADVSCPESISSILKNIQKNLTTGFEITEPKMDSDNSDQIFVEFTRGGTRILNLHFKTLSDGCLKFESLLAPSQTTE